MVVYLCSGEFSSLSFFFLQQIIPCERKTVTMSKLIYILHKLQLRKLMLFSELQCSFSGSGLMVFSVVNLYDTGELGTDLHEELQQQQHSNDTSVYKM